MAADRPAAFARHQVGEGQRRGERRHRGVHQEAVGPAGALGELGVVPVHGVAGGAVPQGRGGGGEARRGVADEAGIRRAADAGDVPGERRHAGLLGAGQHHGKPVQDAAPADAQHFRRKVLKL